MSEQSLARDVTDLTVVLTRLRASRPPLETSTAGLDAALHARAAVLAFVRQVLSDVRVPAPAKAPGFAELHHQPAAVMVWALAHHPTVTASTSPIDVARTAQRASTTALWEHAATLATRTHLRWEGLNLGAQPAAQVHIHPARDALIADIALIVAAVTSCEPAMAATAEALGDSSRADVLRAAPTNPLRLAADASCRSAPAGSPGWDARPAIDPRRVGVLPVRDAAALPRGLARLADLLGSGLGLSPQHTAALITAQTRITLALAAHAPLVRPQEVKALALVDAAALAAATRPGRGDPRGDVREGPLPIQRSPVLTRPGLIAYAQALASAWNSRDDALTTLRVSDPRPLQQAGECLRAVQAATSRADAARLWPLHTLTQVAAGLDDVLTATCAAVDHQLLRREWLTSRPRSEHGPHLALRWRALEPSERPHAADALHAVRTSRALPVYRATSGHLTAVAPAPSLSWGPARAPVVGSEVLARTR